MKKNKPPKLCLYGCRDRIKKITKHSRYYRWIESVGGNVKVYPCEHEKADYKSVQALADKQHEEIKLLNQDKEDLQVKLGECVEQVVLNNNSWEKKYERMAKLYVGYKRKYASLFKLRETYEKMEEDKPFTEEEKKAAKDYTFKQKETQLESGRIKSEFFLTKKKRKPH